MENHVGLSRREIVGEKVDPCSVVSGFLKFSQECGGVDLVECALYVWKKRRLFCSRCVC